MTWLMLMLVSVSGASPALFHTSAESAVSDTQRVLFEAVDDGVRVEFEVLYEGDATSFGWMIPVFGDLVEVAEGEDGRLEALLEASAPRVSTAVPDDGDDGCGCGATAMSKNDASGGDPAEFDSADTGAAEDAVADVIAEGFTGTYTWQLLAAETAEELSTWLSDNGWQEGDQQEALEAYVTEGGVTFLCVQLAVDSDLAPTAEDGRALPPLAVTWSGSTMRYAAALARNGEAPTQRTTLLTLGDSDGTVASGWSVTPVGNIYGDTLPDELFSDTLASLAGSGATYGLVYAGDHEGQRLTRLDTLAAAEAHTADVVLGFTGDSEDVETRIEVASGAARRVSGAGVWGLVSLLSVAMLRRRTSLGTTRTRR